jgi:hypothetical protein
MPKKLTKKSDKKLSLKSDSDNNISDVEELTCDTKNQSKNDESLSVRKRGRPRKNIIQNTANLPSIKNVNVKKISSPIQDEEIILHLPLYDDDDNENSSEKNLFTMKDDSVFDIFDTTKEVQKGLKSLSSIQNNSDSDSDESINFNTNNKIKTLLLEIKKKDAYITKLKSNLAELKNDIYSDTVIGITKETKTKLLNLKLVNIKDDKYIVVDKTNVACWWCTYNFDTMPCFIPDKYINNTYYVFGCFCTYNCALSYNIGMADYRVSVRTALIKKLYAEIFSVDDKSLDNQLVMAPPKELLEKFSESGGLTIEKFRNKSSMCTKEYKLSLPPIIPLLPAMEEAQRETKTNMVSGKYVNSKR